MSEEKISPEEKLLNLIKGNKTANGGTSEIKLPEKGKIDLVKEGISNRVKRPAWVDSKYLRRLIRPKPILIFLIALLFCFIGYESRPGIKIKDRINFFGQEMRIEKKEIQEEPVVLKPYSYYLQEIGGKSLFSPLVIEGPAVTIASTEKIEDLCKAYQLKGVILGEKPEAFIEDTQARRAFTVNIGDSIGKVQIIDIKEGKVTFGYENQTYDLFF